VIIGVDIGNSAAKAALVEGETVHVSGRLETSIASTEDLAVGLRLLAARAPRPPTAIVAVSVVDRWTARLEQAAETLGLPLAVADASSIPLPTALARADLTGPDRLLAAWAAATLHGHPVIVVDLGTATTVDAVDGDGFFLGGAIVPGMRLAADALATGTARLPRVEIDLPTDAIGTDTAEALQSGIVIGHLGAVRELAWRMRERLSAERPLDIAPRSTVALGSSGVAVPRVVVTGGHSAASWARQAWCEPASPTLPAIADVLDPELILRGLGLLADHLATRPGAGGLS
jgi:type III pantothenate kinase